MHEGFKVLVFFFRMLGLGFRALGFRLPLPHHLSILVAMRQISWCARIADPDLSARGIVSGFRAKVKVGVIP